jgi:DNA-binding GntR family transcriptional regulator
MNQEKHFASIEPREESQPIHEWVYQALCDSILAGEFVPGVSVTLRGIAANLDVSPMPVREAIRRLVAEGALEVLSNRRVRVARINPQRFDELFTARIALEPQLAALAMPNITKRDIKWLGKLDADLNQSLVSGEVDTYINCNRRFHFGIYEKADSPVLLPLVKSLWLQFAPFTRIVFGRVGTDYLQDYHADAILALKQNDAQAFKRAIEQDIREGMQMLSEHIKRKHNGLAAIH